MQIWKDEISGNVKPLNAELNPFSYLLALFGVHYIFHVSREGLNTICHSEHNSRGKRDGKSSLKINKPNCTVQYGCMKL